MGKGPNLYISLEGISKRYGAVTAVDRVDITIGKTEFVSLLGPSGSGKTTLLRMIAGLERPTTGRMLIDGVDVTELPPHKRGVAMVFQEFLLFPHRTVRENLAFPLRMQQLSKQEIASRVTWAAGILSLEGLEDRYPNQLSGGQQQRVALGRGLVAHPKVLLLDEPLAKLNQLMLSIPSDLRFGKDFSFIERLRSVSGVKDARGLYLDTIWRFANGNETFENAVNARDAYAKRLAEILHGHVRGSRTLWAVEQLGELIIATATAPLSPIASWLLSLGKDSLKNLLFERVAKRRILVALQEDAIRAAQDRTAMNRDIGLYIGPLDSKGLTAMLDRVGPHPKAPPSDTGR